MIPATRPVGRLAPSPTGAQHVGNARTYLLAWLSARSQGGRVVLRIEDVDSPRIKPGAASQALDDLRWLGLTWDEDPVIQTERLPLYEAALRHLQEREHVYPCTCTRSDVDRAASAPHAEHEGPVYPGTCAGRSVADAARLDQESTSSGEGRSYSWRFRLPPQEQGCVFSFVDGFRGRVEIDLHRVGGDFVVWKAGLGRRGEGRGARDESRKDRFPLAPRPSPHALPAYQLAVVVDDAAQGVTEVVRGDDLVPSTPRQLLLYEALGLPAPRFIHVPLVVGPDGRRLAKRHGDTRLSALRAAGVCAEMLLGLLAWSCGWLETIRPVTASELLPLFRLDTIPRAPFVLTPELLAQIA